MGSEWPGSAKITINSPLNALESLKFLLLHLRGSKHAAKDYERTVLRFHPVLAMATWAQEYFDQGGQETRPVLTRSCGVLA
jgi:hypothetical protein